MDRTSPAWFLVAVCAIGCAKNVVVPMTESRATQLPRPALVLVYDPTFREDAVAETRNPNVEPNQREELGKLAANAFAAELVEDITKLGMRAERAGPATQAAPNALVVTGQFFEVDEGNRARRLVVGFGDGAARVEARVQVYDAGTKLLEFETHADSGKMPGGAVTMGAGVVVTGGVNLVTTAGGAVVGRVRDQRSAIEQMAAKSGKQASAYLSEYFGKQGWIAADSVKKAKQ